MPVEILLRGWFCRQTSAKIVLSVSLGGEEMRLLSLIGLVPCLCGYQSLFSSEAPSSSAVSARESIRDDQSEAERRSYPPVLPDAQVETYKKIEDIHLKMYVFSPRSAESKEQRPAIVFFFGGGWRSGTPSQFAPQCRYFASRGMVAMTADYRVFSRHGTKVAACVSDAKSAIRWVRINADRLGIDPSRIVAAGGSAGGHIAACTAVVPGFEGEAEDQSISSLPNALVLFNPVMALAPIDGPLPQDDLGAAVRPQIGDDPRSISPFHHLKANLPPTIIFFGTSDRLLKRAESYAEAAKRAGNRCELLTWKGLPHGFFNYGRFDNRPYAETLRAADEFLTSLGYLVGEPTVETPQ